MEKLRPIIWSGYAAATLLVAIPLLDTILTVWPFRPGDVSWRFGAVGIFSRALMTPLFGFFTLFALSLAFEHRRVTRTLAVISGVLVVCIAGGMLFFVLDAIQMRVQVRPEAVRTFDVATIAALAKYGAAIIVGLGFAIPGWKASRRREGVVRRNSGGLVGRSNAAAQVAAE